MHRIFREMLPLNHFIDSCSKVFIRSIIQWTLKYTNFQSHSVQMKAIMKKLHNARKKNSSVLVFGHKNFSQMCIYYSGIRIISKLQFHFSLRLSHTKLSFFTARQHRYKRNSSAQLVCICLRLSHLTVINGTIDVDGVIY